MGTTFVAYTTKVRMDEAARLLKETQKNVKEIAALCGYHDYFYFCRVFREYHSCTPTAFREAAL
jgi:two-component system response regulator YesN